MDPRHPRPERVAARHAPGPLATSLSFYPLPSPSYLILLCTCICFPQIMEAMRLRIIQLEEELAQRESGASQVRTSVESGYVIAEPPSQTSDARPAKRARVDNEDASASTSTPSAATTSKADAATTKADKADAKKRKMQFKTFFDRLKKELKTDAVKFQGKGPKTIKFDEVLAPADFEGLFGVSGCFIVSTIDDLSVYFIRMPQIFLPCAPLFALHPPFDAPFMLTNTRAGQGHAHSAHAAEQAKEHGDNNQLRAYTFLSRISPR